MATALIIYDQSTYVLSFLYTIYYICIGNYDVSTWPALLEMSVPFDTKTIYGWYLLMFMLIIMDVTYLLCMFLGTTHFMGCCIYIGAICTHFDLDMQTIQAKVEQMENRMEIKMKIHKAIQIHVKVNE